MKLATIIIQTLIGLLLLYASISFFLNLTPDLASTGDFKAFQVGLIASVYLMPLVKILEFLCGLAFLTGRYVTLANIIILPVTINIFFVNFFLYPEGIPVAILIFLGNLFLIYRYWNNYKSLFVAK